MSKITVNETVTRSVSFENNQVDVQTALDRCFQFLEEERFDEAHVIIEQVLNIEPNNTDAHVANFLYQFKLTCAEDVVQNFKDCITYENSVFYKRVKRGIQTELAKEFFHYFGQAHEQFNIEQERIRKEEEHRQEILLEEAKHKKERIEVEAKCHDWVTSMVFFLILTIVLVFAIFMVQGDRIIVFYVLAVLSFLVFYVSVDSYNSLKKQLSQQKTDQAAD